MQNSSAIIKLSGKNGMKKFTLAGTRTKAFCLLAGIMTVVTFSSGVSALPLFSRQTGMVCSACHFQHFPMLNGFGRAFKSAGYTMMGVQGKVEGEGLTIPNTLNMAVMASAGYEKTNQAAGTNSQKTTGDGAFYVPGTGGELSLFYGGRVTGNAGFLAEIGTGGSVLGTVVSGVHNSAKMPVLFQVTAPQLKLPEGTLAGVVPFTTDDHGASYGFELLNTGASVVHQMSPVSGLNGAHSAALSAQQFIGTAGSATGVAFVANSSMGFINLTKYDQSGITGGTLAGLGSTYIRVAGIFDLAGWDAGAGVQIWRGNSAANVAGTYQYADTRATAFDGQLQGRMGGTPVGFYASYATAPAGNNNTYNMDPAVAVPGNTVPIGPNGPYGTATKSAFNISAEVGVIPDKVTLGVAIRYGKSGVAVGGASNASDNAITLMSTYKLAQNMLASFSLTSANGGYWDAAHQNALGSATTTFNIFALF
jgi:hypothetical protein